MAMVVCSLQSQTIKQFANEHILYFIKSSTSQLSMAERPLSFW